MSTPEAAHPAAATLPGETRLGDFSTNKRLLLITPMAVVVGVISALVAYVLVWLIGLITNLAYYHRLSTKLVSPADNQLGLAAVLVPMAGGLIIGLMVRYGSEKIRGHGIPEAMEAILIGRSRMSAKVALLKPLSSAISIGTGGPFGAEGPIIMTGGALGSLFAQAFHLSAAERKTLLVAGAAAGMAAIFATPLAAVLLAVELLLFEWKPRSFIPVAAAAAVAAALRHPGGARLRRSHLAGVHRRGCLCQASDSLHVVAGDPGSVRRRGYHAMREYIVNPLTRVRMGDVRQDGVFCSKRSRSRIPAGSRDHGQRRTAVPAQEKE